MPSCCGPVSGRASAVRAERRAADLQQQLRSAHQQLGVPPLDYLIVAIAEDHDAAILQALIHYAEYDSYL